MSNNFYYKNNRMQQLKGFYHTVQKGTLAKAAKHLNISQSAVSLQISTLEDHLGVKLFVKEGRNKKLTKEGKLFYKYAIDVVQRVDNIYERFIKDNIGKQNTLDISTNQACLIYLIPKYISEFKEKYNNIKINLRNIPMHDGINRLINNETDICFYPLVEIPDECEFLSMREYDPVLLVDKDHPLANFKRKLTIEDVSKYDLIRIDNKFITLPLFEELAKTHKLRSSISFENGDWEIIKALAKNKAGIILLSSICLDDNVGSLVSLPLQQYFPSFKYGALIKKGVTLSDPVVKFLKIISKDYKFKDESISLSK